MNGDGEVEVTARELAWFALKHPLKGLALILVAALGLVISVETDWTMSILKVSRGETAEAHRYAEGIE